MGWLPDSLKDQITDGTLGFVSHVVKKCGADDIAKKIDGWRSDRVSQTDVREAIDAALQKLEREFPADDSRATVSLKLIGYDKERIDEAVESLVKYPQGLEPKDALRRIFKSALIEQKDADSDEVTRRFLDFLFEELLTVKKLQEPFKVWFEYTVGKTLREIADLLKDRLPVRPDLDAARRKYLDYLIREHQYLYPRGIRQTERSITLALDEVYVSLTAERKVELAVDAEKFFRDDPEAPSEEREIERELTRRERLRVETRIERVELPPTVRNHSHVVILGDPGAGKTTLVRFLAYQFARTLRDGNGGGVRDKHGNEYGAVRLPIPVRVSSYADAFSRNRNLSLREFLPTAFSDAVDCTILKEVFEQGLEQGDALVLLDGLDEIVDSSDRIAISGKIESFVNGIHRENRFIVTSRVAGYRQAQLNQAQFAHFLLRELERPQIEQFLDRWCLAAERFHTPDDPKETLAARAKVHIDGILKAVDENPGVKRLAENPLMLAILALIHRTGARLPSRRIELYQLAVNTLLKDWRLAQGVKEVHLVTTDEANRLLGPLAYWMHTHRPTGLIRRDEAVEKLSEYLGKMRNLDPEHAEVGKSVEDFLERVRQHTGIFVERLPGRFGFLHLTFEEYFTAREIIRRFREAPDKIYLHRHDPRWLEPILLAIADISGRSPEDASELIQTAILAESEEAKEKGFKPSLHEDILHRDLLLAARCIGDCAGTEPEFRRWIIEKVLNLYFAVRSEGKYQPLRERILKAFEHLRGCDACADAVPIALGKLRDASVSVRERAAEALGRLGMGTQEVITGLLWALQDTNWVVKPKAAESLGQLGMKDSMIVKGLINALCVSDREVRAQAAKALGRLGPATLEEIDSLKRMLRSEKGYVRSGAVEALGWLGVATPEIVSELLVALRENDWNVRASAAQALGRLNVMTREAVNGLVTALWGGDFDVRIRAAEALGKFGSETPGVVDGLLGALQAPEEYVRPSAVEALGRLGIKIPGVVSGLIKLLHGDSDSIRVQAGVALARLGIGTEGVITGVVGTLRTSEGSVRRQAVEVLVRLGPGTPEMLNKLIYTLQTSRWDARASAAETLGRLGAGTPEVIERLIVTLQDSEGYVRVNAAEALVRLEASTPQVVKELVDMLGDNDGYIRGRAALALGQVVIKQSPSNPQRAEKIAKEIRKTMEVLSGRSVHTTINEKYYENTSDAMWDALWMVCQAIDERCAPA